MVSAGRREAWAAGRWAWGVGGKERRERRERVCIVLVVVAEEVMVERMGKGMEGECEGAIKKKRGEERSVEGGRFA
ncbi:hypothetical protein E2C01_101557 [Portunus trituberculatus]|uniref:Uncharacterized protein n=1 Tax=Portunus trituberculatus TaxID=210409 RepID=A0A5B7K5Y8_PORTR|nr:hypothetical protein [Portunus trituberculatus]